MANNDQEIEVKFFLRDLSALEKRLKALNARIVAERVHEVNLRFDTPDNSLQQARQVLRLRHDFNNVVTFKGPARGQGDAMTRQEIEFRVSNFVAARRVFEALGYEVRVMYEKYRTTYQLENVLVTLDEMPYGSFAEIEGTGSGSEEVVVAEIRAAAAALGLDWEARITASYIALFDRLRLRRGLNVKNLSFPEFKEIKVTEQDLELRYAD